MTTQPKKTAGRINHQHLAAALKEKFSIYGGEAQAKRLRINAARVSSTARDLLKMVGSDARVPNAERDFLREVATFFDGLNDVFKAQQTTSKLAKSKAEAEWHAKNEAEIAATITELFGPSPDPNTVLHHGKALMAFANDADRAKAQARILGVDRWYFFITRMIEFRTAITKADTTTLAREIALVKMDGYTRGRYWNDRETRCYAAGWDDFTSYLASPHS